MNLNKTDLDKCLKVIDWAATMPEGVQINKIAVTDGDKHIAWVVQGEPVAKTAGFVSNQTDKQWEVEL